MSERYELKVTRLANETLGRYYNEQKARAEKAERELAEARAEVADLTQRLDYASTRFPQSVPQSVCDYLAGVARGEPDAVRSMMPFWAKVRPEDLAALLRERETAGATIEASDTTRREWEVRAATSYRDGRAAGLREAAEVRPEVMAFALLMESQLRANDHRPGWKNDAVGALVARLYEEARELACAARDRRDRDPADRLDPDEIGREAADVANFAMMVADVCGALAPPAAETVVDRG